MNSITSISRLCAAALCATLLVACDSIKDVPDGDGTYLATPPLEGVIGGTIRGLGAARPIVLTFDGDYNCIQANSSNSSILEPAYCSFFGFANEEESTFSFGARATGTPYFVEVVTQPFTRICVPDNGLAANGQPASPTNPRYVGDGLPDVVINCTVDLSVPRFDLTVDTSAMNGFSDARLTLVTEDGTWTEDVVGNSVTFDDVLFDSLGTQLPDMQYRLTASYTGDVDGEPIVSYCSFEQVTAGPDVISLGGTNVNALTNLVTIPTHDTNVAIDSCFIDIGVTVQYAGLPAVAQVPAGGLELGLRNHFTKEVTQTLSVPAAAPFDGTTVYSFTEDVPGNAKSIYEIVVTAQPANMHCVVGGTVSSPTRDSSLGANNITPNPVVTGATGSAVLALNPSITEWWFAAPRKVYCRTLPATVNANKVLTGTYQRDRALQTAAQIATNARSARAREFLTFFSDGTFLFGINAPNSVVTTCEPAFQVANSTPPGGLTNNFPVCTGTNPVRQQFQSGPNVTVTLNYNAVSGVNHGFYDYDPVAQKIVFYVTNASNIFPNYFGLNGMPGYANGQVTAGNVVKTNATGTEGGKIQLFFKGARPPTRPGQAVTFAGPNQTATWRMTEPDAIPGEITGAWITPDHLRMFAYNKSELYGLHMGIDGLATLQDACWGIDDFSTQSAGNLNRREVQNPGIFNPATCSPGGSSTFRDIPNELAVNLGVVATMPRLPPGYQGRFPGSENRSGGTQNSPAKFVVTAAATVNGAGDELEVHATQQGTPIDDEWPPATFIRERANPAVVP